MQIFNLNKKRVCDLSNDRRIAKIRKGDCVTLIRIGRDGTLYATHMRDKRSS